MQPSDPPLEVMLIILSVVTAAAALQAAGGMDWLVKIAGKILRSRPQQITLLGPIVTYLFTLFAGTAHISYCILPIVAEVAIKARIRPERALSMSVTAAHMGITASPVSAASAALLTVLAASGVKLSDILLICIPSTLIGVLVGILFVYKRGKELSEDKEFLERMKDPAFAKNLDSGSQNNEVASETRSYKIGNYFCTCCIMCCSTGFFSRIASEFFRKRGIYSRFLGKCLRPGPDAFDDNDDNACSSRIDNSFCKNHTCPGNQSQSFLLSRPGSNCCFRCCLDEQHIYES